MFPGIARRRRAREMERRLRELDRWDELYGVGSMPPPGRRPRRGGAVRSRGRRIRRRSRVPVGWLMVACLVVGAVAFPTRSMALLDRVGQAASDLVDSAAQRSAEDGPTISFGSDVGSRSVQSGWQPPTGSRVLPPVPVSTDGAHEFLGLQPGTAQPVGFSPCGVVEVEVNPEGAPQGYAELVADSLARISAATGLSLQLIGQSAAQFDEPRSPGDPVLIGWSSAEQLPELAGPTAGYGGPLIVTDGRTGQQWLASGAVVIDRESAAGGAAGPVLDHELAHVMGLGHVDDPQELMAPTYAGQDEFGPGDLAGLARVGAIDCP